jgi:hypothetical protein
MTHIQELRDTIHHLYGAKASHLESVPIIEWFQGKTIWDGAVEVFLLEGHPKTDRVYAWMHDTDDPARPKRHVTVLHIPPVVSPRTAVQAVIIQESKGPAKTKSN